MGSNLTRTLYGVVLPPSPILVSFAKITAFLQQYQREGQSSTQSSSSWVFVWVAEGGGEDLSRNLLETLGVRVLELATVNEKHNSNADMYFTKLFFKLHGKKLHQLPSNEGKRRGEKLRYSIIRGLFLRPPSRNRLPSFHSIRYCYNKITSWVLMVS